MPIGDSVVAEDGTRIAVTDLGGSGPVLVLVHATGFCGGVLGALAADLDGRFRCITFDQRGHGDSARPPGGNFDWHGFASDVLAVVDGLGARSGGRAENGAVGGAAPVYGFGHSCGAAALLLAEQARPGTFAGLACYEPIVYPADVPLEPSLDGNPLAAGALRRRTTFPSRADALANFSSKPPLDVLDPACLAAYVACGFRDLPDGSVTLKCRPEDEAQVYANGFAHDAFAGLGAVRCPTLVMCGARTDAIGEELVRTFSARLPRGEAHVFDTLGHFGPLEEPGTVAERVSAFLLRPGAGAGGGAGPSA